MDKYEIQDLITTFYRLNELDAPFKRGNVVKLLDAVILLRNRNCYIEAQLNSVKADVESLYETLEEIE